MTTTPSQETVVLNADPEHGALRFAVLLFLGVVLWLFFLLLRYLLRAFAPELGSSTLLGCIGALPLALLVSAGFEAWLKRVWPSGLRLLLSPRQLVLERHAEADVVFEREQTINRIWWQFPLTGYGRGGKERRVPDKWHCVAGQLQQEHNRLSVFCFVPPETAERWQSEHNLFTLDPRDVYDSSLRTRMEGPQRPEIPADVITGPAGRYWLAERNRWHEGIELMPDDFETLLVAVERDAHI